MVWFDFLLPMQDISLMMKNPSEENLCEILLRVSDEILDLLPQMLAAIDDVCVCVFVCVT